MRQRGCQPRQRRREREHLRTNCPLAQRRRPHEVQVNRCVWPHRSADVTDHHYPARSAARSGPTQPHHFLAGRPAMTRIDSRTSIRLPRRCTSLRMVRRRGQRADRLLQPGAYAAQVVLVEPLERLAGPRDQPARQRARGRRCRRRRTRRHAPTEAVSSTEGRRRRPRRCHVWMLLKRCRRKHQGRGPRVGYCVARPCRRRSPRRPRRMRPGPPSGSPGTAVPSSRARCATAAPCGASPARRSRARPPTPRRRHRAAGRPALPQRRRHPHRAGRMAWSSAAVQCLSSQP